MTRTALRAYATVQARTYAALIHRGGPGDVLRAKAIEAGVWSLAAQAGGAAPHPTNRKAPFLLARWVGACRALGAVTQLEIALGAQDAATNLADEMVDTR